MTTCFHSTSRRLWSLATAWLVVLCAWGQTAATDALWRQTANADIQEHLATTTEGDTARLIDEVVVTRSLSHHETIAPQVLSGQRLERVSAHTVADALRWMSGVQLKDYGGVGGLKTVNLRSLGSQHVGIYYDGIELGNAQNGVTDLGQLSLDNVQEVSLYNGQRSSIFQTASDYMNAGSIYIRTLRPDAASPHTRLKAQTGWPDVMRASVLHTRPLGRGWVLSANIEGLTSSGHYPFSYRRRNLDGTMAYDTTAIRQNGDVCSLRAEANLYGRVAHGEWQGKFYTYHANRGIPGAIVNNVWRRGERQSDHNTMVQTSWQRDVNPRLALRLQGKYAIYQAHYQNRDTTTLRIDNTYRQQEAYANATAVLGIASRSSLSVSSDVRFNYLQADLPRFSPPTRWTHLLSVADACDFDSLQLQASLVWSHTTDAVIGLPRQRSDHFTPAFFASLGLASWLKLTGYAKRSLRMPTFNDLYYTEIGNALLRPERAQQYALGLRMQTSSKPSAQRPWLASLQIDAYHNAVRDKIVAYPRGQQFRWTMLNLGRVSINGLELRADASWLLRPTCRLSTMLQYTLQQAEDRTDPASSYYGHQIPYTPWHSGSATCMLDVGRWSWAYNFVYTGERYCQPENIAYNHVQPWYTSDFTLGYRTSRWQAQLEVRNVLDQQYDVIANYPMPGRSVFLGIIWRID